MTSKVIDPCVYCGLSTAFGSGRFVNRIIAMTDTAKGFMCEPCSNGESEDE